jgi:DNA modification methylase
MKYRTAVELIPLDQLKPWDRNPKRHPKVQIERLAGSLQTNGWTRPVIIDEQRRILAGHGIVQAARFLKLAAAPCIVADGLTETQCRAYVIADNRLTELGAWDEDTLRAELEALATDDVRLDDLGFDDAKLVLLGIGPRITIDPDVCPPLQAGPPVSQLGEVYQLGPHRLMCGDSTSAACWQQIMGDDKASLLHADPPYGMGKQADGVINDNLYREKLDAFQLEWWRATRPHLADNASVYIWGNAPDLWRLWYGAGLCAMEDMVLRNEIVWDKKTIPGMGSDLMTQYPEASERCLFIQIGEQFLGNINSCDFPEEWEPLRSYMEDEAKACGLTPGDIKRVCGCGMYAHWFTRSQYGLIPEKHYAKLAEAYPGRFSRPWPELKTIWDGTKGVARAIINDSLSRSRSYFDNTHDIMRDVWDFSRVTGEERYGHATPKPVAMMERCLRSSSPEQGIVIEPFAGTGTTLIAAAQTNRICRTMEVSPSYCDVVRRRWTAYAIANAIEPGPGRLDPLP